MNTDILPWMNKSTVSIDLLTMSAIKSQLTEAQVTETSRQMSASSYSTRF